MDFSDTKGSKRSIMAPSETTMLSIGQSPLGSSPPTSSSSSSTTFPGTKSCTTYPPRSYPSCRARLWALASQSRISSGPTAVYSLVRKNTASSAPTPSSVVLRKHLRRIPSTPRSSGALDRYRVGSLTTSKAWGSAEKHRMSTGRSAARADRLDGESFRCIDEEIPPYSSSRVGGRCSSSAACSIARRSSSSARVAVSRVLVDSAGPYS
mmetsp:Transcript_1631/g.4185  ORF Transcript_1631/g.4185 Transcript_1631/m.4185 type:complete len:209 (+) Transcript_1631:290-916(+)